MEGLWWHTRLKGVNGATLVEIVRGVLPCNIRHAVDDHLSTITRCTHVEVALDYYFNVTIEILLKIGKHLKSKL
jgi:hypothetical protein